MILTLDGVPKKRGEKVWEIGRNIDDNLYVPTLSVVHSKTNPVINSAKCWDSHYLCGMECKRMNMADQMESTSRIK